MSNVAVMNGNIVSNLILGDIEIVSLIMPEAVLIEESEQTGPAYIGGEFLDGRFRPASPFPSWVWDDDTFSWIAPIPYPQDGKVYVWDESTGNWVQVSTEGLNEGTDANPGGSS